MTPLGPPVWVTESAGRFWSAAGPPPPFPRDLTTAATFALPVSVFRRPALTLAVVAEVLARHHIPVPYAGPDRPLRAALYCLRGSGFIFLDANDPPDEQRFSLAHEVAHFLRDADDLRRLVRRRLGPVAVEVLDGVRPPSEDERVQALLRNLALAPLVHLMNRDPAGRPDGERERAAEDGADRLAFELLAPFDRLPAADAPALLSHLRSAFGLPVGPARRYLNTLLPDSTISDPVVERISKFC